MASSFRLLGLFLVFSLQYVFCWAAPYGCGPGVKTAGYTYPMGDITLRSGENLDITCVLNELAASKYGPNASQYMHFTIHDTKLPVEIVNSTAIKFHIEDHPKTKSSDYSCMVNKTFVCHNVVIVGTPPQDVTDFDCIGYNYENFTCSWTPPTNYVATNYDLEYAPTSRSARFAYKCPENLTAREINGKTTMSCTWGLGTKPQYRHSHDNFTFKLFAKNTFGEKTWEFPVQHYTRVRSSPPEGLVAVAISPHSIKLQWKIPLYMQSYPPGLEHRVSWCIEQNKKWTTVYLKDIKSEKDNTVTHELTNLPYAHCLYDIRVSMKSKPATEERMWSQNTSSTVWTLSKIPDCPPKTTLGSFELLEGTGNRLIYWQNIKNYQKNDANFSTYIQVDEDLTVQPTKVHNNYAKFENLPDRNYTFRIWSRNSVGNSSESSIIFFPAQKYALKQLSKLVKIDKGYGEYDLRWTESSDQRVTNYTLFWCDSQKERPFTCDGTLQWETLPRAVKNKTLKLSTYDQEKNQTINNYHFAISANGYGTSSGLLWADCTVIPGTGVKLRQTYVKKVGPRFIVLQWKLECTKLGDIESFNVSYCISQTPQSQECQPNSMKYKLFDNNTFRMGEGELKITDLRPYTLYKICVKPIVTGAESQFSDPMFNSTREDTPTEPRNLKVIQKSERFIFIQWEKPLEENGHLQDYIILINGRKEIRVPANNAYIYREKIDGLLPRSNYTIHVIACTTSCSNSSLYTSTEIGYPGMIPKPSANWDNYSLIIKWEKPDEVGVKVDFYQIHVGTTKEQDDSYDLNVTEQFHEINICQQDKSQTVYVKIRGVNVKHGDLLRGNWSEKAVFPCFRSPSSSTWIIPLVVISVIIFIVLMSYLVKRVWRKVMGMSHCPVKLPEGLEVSSFDQKEKHSDETLPGEPLLPEKFVTQPRNPSGETSGCCSGTESVSSSVESAGHLSMSDSGTEQPRSPSLGDSEHKDVSLRQRPNVKKTDYVTMPDISQAPWSTKPAQSGYCVIGVSAPPKKPDLDSEYMPLSDIPAKSSYVPISTAQSQEPTKEPATRAPTSGYVPYLPQEPAAKNTAYVLAGEPTSAKPAMKLTSLAYTPKEDGSSGYVRAPPIEAPKLQFPWQQQPPLEPPSTGYVVVGDSKPQKADTGLQRGSNKGYVPHNIKFETKSLKED